MFKMSTVFIRPAFCTQPAFYSQPEFYTQSAFHDQLPLVSSLQSAIRGLRFTLTVSRMPLIFLTR